jgi:hypothetical protein
MLSAMSDSLSLHTRLLECIAFLTAAKPQVISYGHAMHFSSFSEQVFLSD